MIVPALLLVAGWAALALALRPLAGRAPVWPAAEPLPFAILAGAALVLRARWSEIPARFAIHFGLDGRPDGWAPRTPAAVYAPLAIGALAVAVLILLRAGISAASPGTLGAPEGRAGRRQAGAILLGVEHFVATLCATASFLALGATLRQVLAVAGAGLLLLLVGIAADLAARVRSRPDDPSRGGGWRAGGIVYRDPADPALWVPKRIGIGWTLNFGHPAAWWVLALLLVGPFAVAAAMFLFAATR